MKRVGVVLTSGLDNDGSSPDFEGKIRLLAGIEYLRRGKIERLYVLGGMEVDGVALDQYYLGYLLARLKNTSYIRSVSILRGGVDTASDLKEAVRFLQAKDKSDLELVVFTSGYHVPRVALVLKELNLNAKVVAAESVVSETHPELKSLSKRLSNQEHAEYKILREHLLLIWMKLDLLPGFKQLRLAERVLVTVRKWAS